MSHWYAAAKRGLASLTKKQAKDRYHADRAAHHRAVLTGTLRDGTLGSVIPKHAAANFKASAANGTLGLWVRKPENLHELHKESYAMPRRALSPELSTRQEIRIRGPGPFEIPGYERRHLAEF